MTRWQPKADHFMIVLKDTTVFNPTYNFSYFLFILMSNITFLTFFVIFLIGHENVIKKRNCVLWHSKCCIDLIFYKFLNYCISCKDQVKREATAFCAYSISFLNSFSYMASNSNLLLSGHGKEFKEKSM